MFALKRRNSPHYFISKTPFRQIVRKGKIMKNNTEITQKVGQVTIQPILS